MRRPFLRASLLALVPLLAATPTPQVQAVQPWTTLWTAVAGAVVYTAPTADSTALTRLPENEPLRVIPVDATWARTTLWNALPAWVPLGELRSQPVAGYIAHASPPLPPPVGLHAPMALVAHGRLRVAIYVRTAPAFAAAHRGLARRGATVAIDSWATDGGGAAWYHAVAAGISGWVYGDAVTFDASPGAASLAPLHGKGMWFTYDLLQSSSVAAIVTAARAAGVTHLYVEVGRSNTGFYGGPGLAMLLPAAHRAGIRVIAWIYPYLENLPADVAISQAAAGYVAPSGNRPDGLLADVEENMNEGAVRAYGQILRATLGPRTLMAVATYPPQWAAGRTYPFATVALSWNAIVPMDYWHVHRRAYSPAEVYAFVRDGIRLIRAQTRPDEPIEVLGQMFDTSQSGVNSPNAAEIAACAAAARDGGAVGLSFFEWNHATPEEWSALATLHSSQEPGARSQEPGARSQLSWYTTRGLLKRCCGLWRSAGRI